MKVEILGSGGALTTPRPGCTCRVCVEARDRGLPYSRTGPSTFVHGPDVLFDTPEEIKDQLNRSQVRRIAACFYSHWHPDHTMGRRVWEMNGDFRTWPPEDRDVTATPVYFPEQVAADFREYLAGWAHLSFLEQRGYVRLVELADGETVTLDATTITPFRLAEDYVYAFVLERNGKRLLIAPDELNGWEPPDFVRGVDLAVLPMGIAEFDPLTGERRIHPEHPLLRFEATFDETLAIIDRLGARRVVLSHVEEMDGLSYDDLEEVARRLRQSGRQLAFAYDTMTIDV